MLSERARRYLGMCERYPAVPTADVERVLQAGGWLAPAAWLDFHDRYAGYVERIYRDMAIWGLAHLDSFWFGPLGVEVDSEDDGSLTIYCAELHPSYGYRLDSAGRFLGCGLEADCFDIHVERLALWGEFIDGGLARKEADQQRLGDPAFRAELLATLEGHLVAEATDSWFAVYSDGRTLVRDDVRESRLRTILSRER